MFFVQLENTCTFSYVSKQFCILNLGTYSYLKSQTQFRNTIFPPLIKKTFFFKLFISIFDLSIFIITGATF